MLEVIAYLARLVFKDNGTMNTWPRHYKTFFMLNSTEQEISTAHKKENTEK